MSRWAVLLLVAVAACAEPIQHGVVVPLTVREPACDATAHVAAHSLHVSVASGGRTAESDFPFTTPPTQVGVAPSDDVSIFVEARDEAGAVVARGSAVHLTLPDAGVGDAQIVELYPVGRFTRECATLATPRSGHTATVLPSGAVVVAGGADFAGTSLASVEVISFPAQATSVGDVIAVVTSSGVFRLPRTNHAAVLTPMGQVVVSAGEQRTGPSRVAQLSTVLFLDPALGFLSGALGAPQLPPAPRSHHEAVLLDGGVFLVGGKTSNGPVAAVERIDLQTLQFTRVGALPDARLSSAVGVVGANILVAGGHDDAGVVSAFLDVLPRGDVVHTVRRTLRLARSQAAVAAVGERALLVGGVGAQGALISEAEWLTADAEPVPGPTLSPHVEPCAVALGERVLVLGGSAGAGLTAAAELVGADGTVETLTFPGQPRVGHRCVRLHDGSALIVGGEGPLGVLGDVWRFVPP